MSVAETVDERSVELLRTRGTPALLAKHLNIEDFRLYRHTLAVSRFAHRIATTHNGRGIVTMPPRFGKLLAVETPVATPAGWKALGDIEAGDEVFAPDGRPVRVEAAHPVEQVEVWRVRFSDGAELLSGPEHLWATSTWTESRRLTDRRRKTSHVPNDRWPTRWWEDESVFPVRRTDAIAATIEERHRIPTTAPIEMPPADWPIDPWLVGFWLGDGTTGTGSLTVNGDDLPAVLDRLDGWRTTVTPHPVANCARVGLRGFAAALRAIDPMLLTDKQLPEHLWWGMVDQRLALLRGLMDSDGGVERAGGKAKGRVSFTNQSKHLAQLATHLAQSLGESVYLDDRPSKLNGIPTGATAYRVAWSCYNHVPFTVPRKADDIGMGGRRHRQRGTRYIESITPTGVVGNLRCLTVEGGMWVAGEAMIPTHNSLVCSRMLALWALDWLPSTRVILASYGASLAVDNGKWIRDQIEQHPDELRVRLAPDSKKAGRWNTPQGGGVLAAGVGSAMTGFGADLMVLDDLFKNWQEAHSETQRDNVHNWFMAVPRTRMQPGGSMLLVSTRWHEDDLIGRLLAADKDGRWEVLNLPGLAEDDDAIGREPGEPLCPEMYSLEEMQELIDDLTVYLASALIQQHPSAPEGEIFLRSKWVFIDPDEVPRRFSALARHWDLASTKGGGDETAGALVGIGPEGAYVLDIVHGRWSSAKVKETVVQTAELDAATYGKGKVHYTIEQEPGASGRTVGDDYVNDYLVGYSAEAKTSSGEKEVRAVGLAARQQRSRVFIPRAEGGHESIGVPSWAVQLINQGAEFPHGKHDDLVDAVSNAYNYAAERARKDRKSKGTARSVATRGRA